MPCSCNKQGLVYRDAHHFPAFSPRKKQIFETPMNKTDELRTARIESLVTPAELAQRHPVSAEVAAHVSASRRRIEKILNGEDRRLLVIIGPCSIHDPEAAMEYARRLQSMRERYQPQLEIVMRTYFEKPRTVVGWKGLISDPDLNGSYRVNHGIELARRLLLQINELGIPTATEFLDMVTGVPSARAPPKAKSTARWPQRSPARLVLKTVPTATPASRSTRFALRAPAICSCRRINRAR